MCRKDWSTTVNFTQPAWPSSVQPTQIIRPYPGDIEHLDLWLEAGLTASPLDPPLFPHLGSFGIHGPFLLECASCLLQTAPEVSPPPRTFSCDDHPTTYLGDNDTDVHLSQQRRQRRHEIPNAESDPTASSASLPPKTSPPDALANVNATLLDLLTVGDSNFATLFNLFTSGDSVPHEGSDGHEPQAMVDSSEREQPNVAVHGDALDSSDAESDLEDTNPPEASPLSRPKTAGTLAAAFVSVSVKRSKGRLPLMPAAPVA